jgi:hypothetical protein
LVSPEISIWYRIYLRKNSSVLDRLSQEDYEFETGLDYTVRPCLKTTTATKAKEFLGSPEMTRWRKGTATKQVFKKVKLGTRVVVHACKPCYLGGKDQEDHSSKPAQAKS